MAYRGADARLAKNLPRSLLDVNEGEIFERNAADAREMRRQKTQRIERVIGAQENHLRSLLRRK